MNYKGYKQGIQRGYSSQRNFNKSVQRRSQRRYSSRQSISNKQIQILKKNSGEKKGMDTILTQGTIVSTTTTNDNIVVLNLVRTGNGSWNRVGKQIYLKSLRLKGQAKYLYSPSTTLGNLNSGPLRMVIIWDKQPSSGSIPTWDTIFGVTTQDGTESSSIDSVIRYDNMARFSILRDCYYNVEVSSQNTSGGSQNLITVNLPFDEYIKLNNRTTVFSGQSTPMTIADISTGALYVAFRAGYDTTGEHEWFIDSTSFARLRYSD